MAPGAAAVRRALRDRALARLTFAAFEEFGWRGYLEPRLAALGVPALRRHLAVGVLWAVWHVPYIVAFGDGYTDLPLAAQLPLFTVAVLAMAVIWGVARDRTGSVWPAVLGHGIANAVAFPLLAADVVVIDSPLVLGAAGGARGPAAAGAHGGRRVPAVGQYRPGMTATLSLGRGARLGRPGAGRHRCGRRRGRGERGDPGSPRPAVLGRPRGAVLVVYALVPSVLALVVAIAQARRGWAPRWRTRTTFVLAALAPVAAAVLGSAPSSAKAIPVRGRRGARRLSRWSSPRSTSTTRPRTTRTSACARASAGSSWRACRRSSGATCGPASRVVDVGGATGVHAEWLLADGHTVHLVDLLPGHVARAETSGGAHDRFTAPSATPAR